MPVQPCPLKKAYVYIDDIECKDCFQLIQGILLPIKGIRNVALENEGDYTTAGGSVNPVIIDYDPAIGLNINQITMVLDEWTFELQKIEH